MTMTDAVGAGEYSTRLRHRYVRQTPYSDPGRHGALFDALPRGADAVGEVARNLLVHYRSTGLELPAERLPEIDLRWVEAILSHDQGRFAMPLAAERAWAERTAGCCRDFSLVTVAGLRHQGVPARPRIGFATYFEPDFHTDHVVVEYWNGAEWVWMDPQLGMATVPRDQFRTAAEVWGSYRGGSGDGGKTADLDIESYGVAPGLPLRGAWFVRNYVLLELAHRCGDELLLWDVFGVGSLEDESSAGGGGDSEEVLRLIDEVAGLLVAADRGDATADRELARLYVADSRLNPRGHVVCVSPSGRKARVDLEARSSRSSSAG